MSNVCGVSIMFLLTTCRPHVQVPSLLTINRAGDMFKGLETHSTLYVLHHSTPLATLDPLEVIHILKMRPKVPSLSGSSGAVSPPPQFSREATPLKRLSESDTSPSPSPLLGSGIGQKSFPTVSHSVLKPEQERDIAIFRSFCAMRLVMDAIWNSIQLANHTHPSLQAAASMSLPVGGASSPSHSPKVSQAAGRKSSKAEAARKLDLGEDGSHTSDQNGGEGASESSKDERRTGMRGGGVEPLPSKLYRSLVLDKLLEAKAHISHIHPLNYRLEVLEDMFSLLFLTSDEIKQPRTSEGVTSTSLSPPVISRVASLDKSDSFLSPGNGGPDGGTATALSSIALIKTQHTFLVGEEVASDLLDMMNDCMLELRTAKFALNQPNETAGHGKKDPSDLSPTTVVKSSVPHTSLHPRSSKLEQFINEARWRLKLVSSKYGITAGGGTSPARFRGQSTTYDLFSSSDESVFELSESEDEKKGEGERETRRRLRKTPSREKEKDATPTPLQTETLSDGKSPGVGVGGRVSPLLASQLSSPAPRPRSITPKLRRSLSPAPKIKRHGSAAVHGSKLKVAKSTPRGSRHTSPVSSAQTQSSSTSGGKKFPGLARKIHDDSGDYAADVEEKSPDVKSSRKKRLRSRSSQNSIRKRRQRKSERCESGGFSKNSVVCKMLASPGSLLRMCLKHGNYNKAKEVMKMFKMEGQFGEAFITFSEDFEQVSSELSRRPHSIPAASLKLAPQSYSPTHTPTKGRPAEDSRRNFSSDVSSASGCSSLQEAILNATSNSGPLDSLHRLLAPASISKMLFSGDEHLEKVASESAVLRALSDHVPSLIMLDLVCSGRMDGQVAKRIVELAVSRSQDALQSLHSRSASLRRVRGSSGGTPEAMLGGPFLLLHTFYEVIGHFAYPGARQPGVVSQPYGSPHSLLTGLLHHLDITMLSHSKSFVDLLRISREKLEHGIYQKQSELSASTAEILIELSHVGGIADETQPTSAQQHMNVTLFDDVIRALSGTPEFMSLPPSSGPSSKDLFVMKRPSMRLSFAEDAPDHCGVHCAYVRQFSRYLVKLVDLLVKCLGINNVDVSNKEMLVVSVLREGPSQLLGWLVFEQGIHPQHLEAMMGDFPQLRIVDVLVKCCCPKLPSNAVISGRGTFKLHACTCDCFSHHLHNVHVLCM